MVILKRLLACATLFVCFQSVANAALTFNEGIKSYKAGDFANAKLIFERLAELGHRDAQYNLGALYNQGQGVAKDWVKAYGWFYLAGDGGDQDAKKAGDLIYKKLSPVDQIEAIKFRDSLIAGYGKAALNASLLPELTRSDLGYCKILRTAAEPPKYPTSMAAKGMQGWVDFEFTINKEGNVKDIFVLESAPQDHFVDAAVRAVRKFKFAPPLVNGRSDDVYGVQHRLIFQMGGEPEEQYKKRLKEFVAPFLQKANEGDPQYQYFYAYLMWVHPDLSITKNERNEWYLKSAQGGFAPAQYSLANSLLYGQGCIPDNAKALEWLTRAAQADYAPAQVLLGRLLLKLPGNAEKEKGVFWLKKASDKEYIPASMVLAWFDATTSDVKLRNPEQALKLAKLVYKDYLDEVTAFETMAAAHAAAGDFKKAVQFQNEALEEAEELGWDLQQLRLRLDAYSNGKAWYET